RSPGGEVEGIDLHGDAAQGAHDVLPGELSGLAEWFERAVGVHSVVGQLAPRFAGIAEQHADAAVDIELGITEGRARAGRQRVQLVSVLAEMGAKRLEQAGSLVEGQLAKRGPADRASVRQGRGHVYAGGGDPGNLISGDRIKHGTTVI